MMKVKALTFLAASLLIALTVACSGNATTPPSTEVLVPATPVPSEVLASPTVMAPTPTVVQPTTAPTSVPTSAPVAAARIAIQAPDKSVQLFTPDGKSTLLAKLDAQLDEGIYHLGTNALGNTIYAVASFPSPQATAPQVYAIDAQGAHLLDFMPMRLDSFVVQSNLGAGGAHLAWSTSAPSGNNPISETFISAPDGSQVKSIAKQTFTAIPSYLHATQWSHDGTRLFYSVEPSGIGGYILFAGFSSLSSYNLTDGKTTELLKPGAPSEPDSTFICLDQIAPNDQLLADHCGDKNIRVLNLTNGKATTIQPPGDVTGFHVLGTARFSPDSSRVAFALARREPDNEKGWVAVSDSLSGGSKAVAQSPANDYYEVAAWLDENTLLLQSHGQQPAVWTVGTDGSNLNKLADGIYLAVAGNP
jgi:hypothetical protein